MVETRARVTFPEAGPWTFGVNSDDGFSLVIQGNDAFFRIEFPNNRGASDTVGVFDVPEAGEYDLRLVYWENGGGASLGSAGRASARGCRTGTSVVVPAMWARRRRAEPACRHTAPSRIMRSTAGPMITVNSDGRMQSTSGMISMTGSFMARSSAA